MTENGNFSGLVSLLVLASLGLTIAGSVLAPNNLPAWLLGGGWMAAYWALGTYHAAARRRLDTRDSERKGASR